MLKCDQAEKMVLPYINDELTDRELEEFLRHISSCSACREELETVFTIYMGLQELDGRADDVDISQALTDSLDRSWVRVRVRRLIDVIRYAVDTLCATGVIVVLVMQTAMWLH